MFWKGLVNIDCTKEGSKISRKTEAVKEKEYPEIRAEKVVEYIKRKISS